MASGIDSQSQSYAELAAGDVELFYCLVDSAATAAVGQVLEFDATGNNFVDFTSGSAKNAYVVCAEAVTLSADTRVKCIVAGKVRLLKLDATAQADAEIEAALLGSGIIPVTGIEA